MESTQEMKSLLKVEDVAKILNIGESTVYHLAQRGVLPHVKVGGALRFRPQALEAYVLTLEKKTYAA